MRTQTKMVDGNKANLVAIHPSVQMQGQRRPVLKPTRWSHDAELQAAAKSGRGIVLTLQAGLVLHGVVLAADQYTVKLRVTKIDKMHVEPQVGVYYKHAIIGYNLVEG